MAKRVVIVSFRCVQKVSVIMSDKMCNVTGFETQRFSAGVINVCLWRKLEMSFSE